MAGNNGPKIITSGLVRMYDLSQFGGWGAPLTYDSSGFGYFYASSIKERVNGSNLTVFNNPSIPLHVKNNVRCRSFRFNNPEDVNSGNYNMFLDDPKLIPITGNSNRTVECWGHLVNSSAQYDGYGNLVSSFAFVRWGGASNTQMCVFGMQGADRLFIMGWAGIPTIYSSYVPSFLNKWVQIAFTNNGNDVNFYVNGESAGTNTFGFTTSSSGAGDLPVYGSTGSQFAVPLGYDSVMRIYNRQLSAAEIKQNFNAQRGKFGI